MIAKWTLSGDWIREDQKVQRRVISSLAKGISILDRENQFGMTNPSPEIGPGGQPQPKNLEVAKNENLQTVASPSFTSLRQKKQLNRSSLVPNKRFSKLFDAKQQPITTISGAKVGAANPNIASLSTEIQIKSAAEHALSLICLRLANFPPKNSCFGLTFLGSAWDEIQSAISIARFRDKMQQVETVGDVTFSNAEVASKFARYFAYQKRLILGIIENPDWNTKDAVKREPSLTLVIRDPEGKYTWSGICKYVDYARQNEKEEDLKVAVQTNTSEPPSYSAPEMEKMEIITSKSENEANIPSISDCCKLFDNFNLEDEMKKLNRQYQFEIGPSPFVEANKYIHF